MTVNLTINLYVQYHLEIDVPRELLLIVRIKITQNPVLIRNILWILGELLPGLRLLIGIGSFVNELPGCFSHTNPLTNFKYRACSYLTLHPWSDPEVFCFLFFKFYLKRIFLGKRIGGNNTLWHICSCLYPWHFRMVT